jgi:hypothetical protein
MIRTSGITGAGLIPLYVSAIISSVLKPHPLHNPRFPFLLFRVNIRQASAKRSANAFTIIEL